MNEEDFKNKVMYWNDPKMGLYEDGTKVPRVTYRCTGKATKEAGLRTTKHLCKQVTDHDTPYCECICGLTFNEKELT